MKTTLILMTLAALTFANTTPANAVPITAPYVELPSCDAHAITLSHELGFLPPFPPIEAISGVATISPLSTCGPFPISFPDWLVSITNLSGIPWVDLFFVADAALPGLPPIVYNNIDGTILGGAAFKIDTVGINAPLISESILANGIFEPFETWDFLVLDWDPAANGGPPMFFSSIGVGTGSVGPPSNASIVANQVPEPSSILLLGVGLASLRYVRRQRSIPFSDHRTSQLGDRCQ